MNPCAVKPTLRLVCCGLSLGLLILMTGCGKKTPRSVEHAEVSGKVLFQGKPLPGGRVTFTAAEGAFAASEIIDENGNYKISAPVGNVKIAVDNSMLEKRTFGGDVPKSFPRAPGMEKEGKSPKGRYVPIPVQYKDPATSGLTYTVKPGPQTHDIELSDKPPGASGQ